MTASLCHLCPIDLCVFSCAGVDKMCLYMHPRMHTVMAIIAPSMRSMHKWEFSLVPCYSMLSEVLSKTFTCIRDLEQHLPTLMISFIKSKLPRKPTHGVVSPRRPRGLYGLCLCSGSGIRSTTQAVLHNGCFSPRRTA